MEKYTKKIWLILCVGILGLFLGCSEQEDVSLLDTTQVEQPGPMARPDFATLDNRSPEEIKSVTFTAEDASYIVPNQNKSAGKHALVIGISDYKVNEWALSYCTEDAIDWKTHLEGRGYSVTALLDEDAHGMAIWAAVDSLAALSVAGTEIAFFFSGHGSRYGLVTWEGWYYSKEWFVATFANVASEKMLFVVDASYAGVMSGFIAPGRIVGTSSEKYSYAYNGDATMNNSGYTYMVMQALDSLGYDDMESVMLEGARQYRLWGVHTNRYYTFPQTLIDCDGLFPL